jgi:predicted enzyme related to lactoylglutathione lyase
LTEEMRGEGVRPHWLLYVGTPSLETSVGAAERLGGAAVSPVIDVPSVGRMRVLRDPQGAAFSLYEPVTPPQSPETPAALGEVAWLELMTTDAAAGLAFYQALFGWRPTEALDMGPMGTYQMFGRDAQAIGGMMNRPPEAAHMPPYWAVYFRVGDVHAAAARATARGATIVNGPMEVPGGGWIVQGIDPQGALFSLFHQG